MQASHLLHVWIFSGYAVDDKILLADKTSRKPLFPSCPILICNYSGLLAASGGYPCLQ
jgi:hypothetical protein